MDNKATDFHKVVLDNLPSGYAKLLILKDKDGNIKSLKIAEANKVFSQIAKTGRQDLAGKRLESIFPDVFQKIILNEGIAGIRQDGNPGTSFEMESRSSQKWYMLTVTSYDPSFLVLIINDITKRKQAEKDLKGSEQRFRSLYENSTIGLYRTTPKGQVIMANPALLKILGYSDLKELLLRNLEEEGFDPDYPRGHFKSVMETEGEIRGLEALWTKKNGTRIYIRESAKAFMDKSGKILYYEGTVEDITERKIAEMQVSELNDIFLELGIDPGKNIDVIVRKACEILKGSFSFYMKAPIPSGLPEIISSFNSPEAVTKALPDVFDRLSGIEPDSAREFLPAAKVIAGNSGFQNSAGERSWIACSFSTDSKQRNLLCVFLNSEKLFTSTEHKIISTLAKAVSLEQNRHNSESQLRKAKTEAELANKSKSQFLANMSHEVRTPLHAILGFSEMLSNNESDKGKRQMLGFIQSSGKQLLYLMNDLLDLSRIEAGKARVEKSEFSLSGLVKESIEYFNGQVAEKGIILKADLGSWNEVIVYSDPYKIRQIVVNLISNAIKFTDRGSVTVKISNLIRDDGIANCRIEVADTGKGIDPRHFGEIFEEFRQLDNFLTKKERGAGLGLSIVKKLLELLHGTIEVDSTPGIGSRFIVNLPLPISKKQKKQVMEQTKEKIQNASLRILVAEDNDPIRFLIRSYGKNRGWDVVEVENGLKAVEIFTSGAFDIILMDVQMPVMDGFEATRRIRENENQSGSHTPILALTANATKSDMEQCFEAGMDDYLAKPFEKNELIAKLSGMLGRNV